VSTSDSSSRGGVAGAATDRVQAPAPPPAVAGQPAREEAQVAALQARVPAEADSGTVPSHGADASGDQPRPLRGSDPQHAEAGASAVRTGAAKEGGERDAAAG